MVISGGKAWKSTFNQNYQVILTHPADWELYHRPSNNLWWFLQELVAFTYSDLRVQLPPMHTKGAWSLSRQPVSVLYFIIASL